MRPRDSRSRKFVARGSWGDGRDLDDAAWGREEGGSRRGPGRSRRQEDSRLDIGTGRRSRRTSRRRIDGRAVFTFPRSRQNRPGAIRRPPSPLRPAMRKPAGKLRFCAAHTPWDRAWAGSSEASLSAARPRFIYLYATDGCRSQSAITQARRVIGEGIIGNAYVPDAPRPVPEQGQERAGGPRRHSVPPICRAVRPMMRRRSIPLRPGLCN